MTCAAGRAIRGPGHKPELWNLMTATQAKLAAVLTIGLLAGGCVKTQSTVVKSGKPVVQPNPGPKVASEPEVRIQTLARLADTLAKSSNSLPGETAKEHRQLMTRVFEQLQQI